MLKEMKQRNTDFIGITQKRKACTLKIFYKILYDKLKKHWCIIFFAAIQHSCSLVSIEKNLHLPCSYRGESNIETLIPIIQH